MQGATTLKAGKYQLAKQVWFEVHQDDRGTSLSLSDHQTNVRYVAVIDMQGTTIDGSVGPLVGEWEGKPERPRPSYGEWYQVVPSALEINRRWREAMADPLKCFHSFAKHKFTLRHGPGPREHYLGWPMAGYEGDGGTYILYRRSGHARSEQLMRLHDGGRVNIEDASDPNRMPSEEWARFLHLPPRKHFTLNGLDWQKMSIRSVAAAVGGLVFEIWGVETEATEG